MHGSRGLVSALNDATPVLDDPAVDPDQLPHVLNNATPVLDPTVDPIRYRTGCALAWIAAK